MRRNNHFVIFFIVLLVAIWVNLGAEVVDKHWIDISAQIDASSKAWLNPSGFLEIRGHEKEVLYLLSKDFAENFLIEDQNLVRHIKLQELFDSGIEESEILTFFNRLNGGGAHLSMDVFLKEYQILSRYLSSSCLLGLYLMANTKDNIASEECLQVEESLLDENIQNLIVAADRAGMSIEEAAESQGWFSLLSSHKVFIHAESLWVHRDVLKKLVGLTAFYNWLSEAPASYLKPKILRWLIDQGLDINKEGVLTDWVYNGQFYRSNPLTQSLQSLLGCEEVDQATRARLEQMIELHLNSGVQCGVQNYAMWADNCIEGYLDYPEKLLDKKHRYLQGQTVSSDVPKIPQVLHHIWLTHPLSPREIDSQDINQVIKNKIAVFCEDGCWEHIVWVNDPSLIPYSVEILEASGVSVRSIHDYSEELNNYQIIQELIELQQWGMASDALRYSIIELFGGVYADLNFVFSRNLTHEVYHYDFFGQDLGVANPAFAHNCCFGAKPHHPILKRATEIIARNFSPNRPDYLLQLEGKISTVSFTVYATAYAISMAYIDKAHESNTVDVLYPYFKMPNSPDLTLSDYYQSNLERLEYYAEKYPVLLELCPDFFKFTKKYVYFAENDISIDPSLEYGYDNGLTAGTWWPEEESF